MKLHLVLCRQVTCYSQNEEYVGKFGVFVTEHTIPSLLLNITADMA
jgi:hypothetical protein